ncbi:4540_t:CDS:10 [Cetraspora pellucida]|uniref:4540_t:CDS:1 n=1 Tax=Cetraspora pellucida TaxID=1433469 RepID=A0A9N9EGB1_9GLOM|nr:4540_t:CDS:10 [Cetraspora pellucida]
MSFNSQYSTVFWSPENEVQYFNTNISDNSQPYFFEGDSEPLTVDQINENQKRSYMQWVDFDNQERATKMAKLDESELSTYGGPELLTYRDPDLSYSESDLSLYGEPGLSSYGDQDLLTYGGQNLLSYGEPGLSTYDYALPFIGDNMSIDKQYEIDEQDIKPYKIDENPSLQVTNHYKQIPLQVVNHYESEEQTPSQETNQYEIDEPTNLQEINQHEIDEQPSLQEITQFKVEEQPSLQEINQYEVEDQTSLQEINQYEVEDQAPLQKINQYKVEEQTHLQGNNLYKIEEQAPLQGIELYDLTDQPSLQEAEQFNISDNLPLQEIKKINISDQLSSQGTMQYNVNDQLTSQGAKQYEIDEQSSLQDTKPYVIEEDEENSSLQDIKPYVIEDEKSPLHHIKSYKVDDLSSVQDLKHEVDEYSSLQDIKPYQQDAKPKHTVDSECEIEVIDLTEDDDPPTIPAPTFTSASTFIDKIKQEPTSFSPISPFTFGHSNFISSLKLSQSPSTLFSSVNNNTFPTINNAAFQTANNILSQNVNSLLSSNVNNNLMLNFNNPPSLNETKPNLLENRPVNYSKSINLQDLLDMIPLDESNHTPVGEAMRKINARKGIIPGLSIQLMDHQVIGVSWMVDQEIKEKVRGGILADDMGLGKTVQTIATLVINRPDTKKSRSSKSTLIVAPTALIYQWKSEILSKTEQDLFSVHVYHGQNKASFHNLKKYDVVITTYQTLLRECPEIEEDDRGSLFRMDWFRVVLDEAQNIKNRHSRASKACSYLSSTYRWCLTGTPIQNHIDDLYPYFRFLDIANFSDWQTFHEQLSSASQRAIQKAQTILRGILLRRTKDSKLDGRPLLELPTKTVSFVKQEFSRDEREFYDALEKRSRIEFNRYLKEGSVLKNYAYILVMLLRLRQACNHPFLTQEDIGHVIMSADDPRSLRHPTLNVNNQEKNIPNQLEQAKKILTDKVIARLFEKYKDNSTSDDCPICYDSAIDSENKENVIDIEDKTCPICRSTIKERDFISLDVFLPPKKNEPQDNDDDHDLPTLAETLKAISSSFSGSDVDDVSPSSEKKSSGKKASEEKSNVINNFTTNNTFANAPEGSFMSSTKIDQLMKELAFAQQEEPGCKTIVFSQWTSMLDLVEEPIKQVGYKFCRYDGTMDVRERDNALRKLLQDSEITIMLVSLKAGGVGLNLTKANRVIMLDCWWNPAVEDQAIDRVHRIGQCKKVIIKRLTIKDTIEDRILILQEKKRELAAGALGEGSIKVGRLTVEDLIFLFRR